MLMLIVVISSNIAHGYWTLVDKTRFFLSFHHLFFFPFPLEEVVISSNSQMLRNMVLNYGIVNILVGKTLLAFDISRPCYANSISPLS